MNIVYTLADPSKNYTILADAERSGIPFSFTESEEGRALLVSLGQQLMAAEPLAEQAGFVFPSENTLYMAGGEFCGNAALSAAALLCRDYGAGNRVELHVSGNSEVCRVGLSLSDELYQCTLSLSCAPLGIRHFVKPCSEPLSEEERRLAEKEIIRFSRQQGIDACGFLFLRDSGERSSAGAPLLEMEPLVFVDSLDSLFWESSCASGSMAASADYCKAHPEQYGIPVSLKQPGGTITVLTRKDGSLDLKNTVRLSAPRSINIEEKK